MAQAGRLTVPHFLGGPHGAGGTLETEFPACHRRRKKGLEGKFRELELLASITQGLGVNG